MTSRPMLEVMVRDCGIKIGFLGLVYHGEQELHRTGRHYPSGIQAFDACCHWIDNEDYPAWGDL